MRDMNMLMHSAVRLTAGLALGLALLMLCSCGKSVAPPAEPSAMSAPKAPPPLWTPTEWSGSYTPTPQAIRSRAVVIDVNKLRPPDNKRLALSLPDGRQITAEIRRYTPIAANEFIWRGGIEGDKGGVVTFSVVNDKVSGDIITSRGRMYRV